LRGHALFNNSLHAKQANPDLILDQFAYGSHPSVAKVVDVIGTGGMVVYLDHHSQKSDDVLGLQRSRIRSGISGKASIQLVPTHPAKIVPSRVEEQVLQ